MKQLIQIFITAAFCASALASMTFAQTTEFTYQGRMTDGSLPANANYDFEFRLFDVDTGGTAIATAQRSGVAVSSGAFTVKLDFGPIFDGSARWLEIAVRSAGGAAFTTLTPRQSMTSTPYSIRSLASKAADTLSVLCVGCVQDANITAVSGAKVTGQIPTASVPQGSGHYIQNTINQQSGDFNLDGNGSLGGTLSAANATITDTASANIVSATTQFNIGISRALALGTASVYAGRLAGASNTTGSGNSFFGDSAGRFNTSASNNSFFGRDAGSLNAANDNSFFGAFSGDSNTSGARNSFFGVTSGDANQTGNDNAFFGYRAGRVNTANGNSFFGGQAGVSNTSGTNNSFFGVNAGNGNTTGSSNTIIGSGADVAFPNLSFATAIGAGAVVAGHNTVVLGRTLDDVKVPGTLNLAHFVANSGQTNSNFWVRGNLTVDGTVHVGNIPSGQSLGDLCVKDPSFPSLDYRISFCSSSIRYKDNIETYRPGLEVVRRLRPITFTWKDGGKRDLGFAAEEVVEVEPLLGIRGVTGQLESVKYKQITTVLVNAVNEQQQIIEKQEKRIDALMRIVCATHPEATLCGEKGAKP